MAHLKLFIRWAKRLILRGAYARLWAVLIVFCGAAAAGGLGASPGAGPPGEKQPLVVVVSVDQMRADYLDRFQDLYRQGFRRLLKSGAVVSEARQNHAETETGPGHATLLTGCVPGHTGIVANRWFDRSRGAEVYCVDSTRHKLLGTDREGSSPELLLRTTLGDWLKSGSPRSKVLSVSRKDRAAILMGGKHPDQAYWFDIQTGQLVTSDYYLASYPAWVDAWNRLRKADAYFGRSWERLGRPEIYRRSDPDGAPGQGAIGTAAFPHVFTSRSGKPDADFYDYLIDTPFIDELILDFTLRALEAEKLGRRGVTDLLTVSFSATDYIGHEFGPDSQEIQDQLLRLDRILGKLLAALDRQVGKEGYLLVLTADHGVMSLPEHLQRKGIQALRLDPEAQRRQANELDRFLRQRLGPEPWVAFWPGTGSLYLDRALLAQRAIPWERAVQEAAAFLKALPWVAEVYPRSLLEAGTGGDSYAQLYRNSYHPERSGDLMIRPAENVLLAYRSTGADHGSPYDYDTRVPLVFMGPPFRKGRTQMSAATVDIAPTLAAVLGIPPAGGLDGRILQEILLPR